MPFKKGNEIGKESRFEVGNNLSLKYKKEYGEMMLEYFRKFEGYPTFELFADSIDVVDDTLRNWCEAYPDFATMYKKCERIQRGRLINGTMSNQYNANFAKFVAINCHGMSEKTTTDTTITFNVDYSTPEIDEESN